MLLPGVDDGLKSVPKNCPQKSVKKGALPGYYPETCPAWLEQYVVACGLDDGLAHTARTAASPR